MNRDNEKQEGAERPAASEPNPKNPFRDDAPQVTPSPQEEAELEQQRKEALTERD